MKTALTKYKVEKFLVSGDPRTKTYNYRVEKWVNGEFIGGLRAFDLEWIDPMTGDVCDFSTENKAYKALLVRLTMDGSFMFQSPFLIEK